MKDKIIKQNATPLDFEFMQTDKFLELLENIKNNQTELVKAYEAELKAKDVLIENQLEIIKDLQNKLKLWEEKN